MLARRRMRPPGERTLKKEKTMRAIGNLLWFIPGGV
jgi:hypothetical protein